MIATQMATVNSMMVMSGTGHTGQQVIVILLYATYHYYVFLDEPSGSNCMIIGDFHAGDNVLEDWVVGVCQGIDLNPDSICKKDSTL